MLENAAVKTRTTVEGSVLASILVEAFGSPLAKAEKVSSACPYKDADEKLVFGVMGRKDKREARKAARKERYYYEPLCTSPKLKTFSLMAP